ncbi:uncharacterized protein vopp1 isoform X2 [Girardinichthys multiradiatus]|uniref:uncharacterized protein vopp1 isoform X2 n=1 Tax=Girardinichthys multiradiatus TaxID=208333 RepID=UPI001FAD4798|nr:uncharacterized protein vopp1 isoform X2 [Girardinichthys multiradiatus]
MRNPLASGVAVTLWLFVECVDAKKFCWYFEERYPAYFVGSNSALTVKAGQNSHLVMCGILRLVKVQDLSRTGALFSTVGYGVGKSWLLLTEDKRVNAAILTTLGACYGSGCDIFSGTLCGYWQLCMFTCACETPPQVIHRAQHGTGSNDIML